MRQLKIGAWALLAMVAASVALGQMGGAVPIHLEPAVARRVRETVELKGVVEPRRASTLGAEVAGRVEHVLVEEGNFVKAGAPICRMRTLPVELQLKQAEGQLAAAKAEFEKMTEGYRPEEIRQAEARVQAAEAALVRWQQEHKRTRQLLADGASTQAEMESVEASYRQAEELLAEANAYLDLVTSGYRAEDIEAARGQVQAQEAIAEELKDTIEKMTVVMPYDGFVVRKRCEVGEWLQPGAPVADVVDLAVARVLVDVPERYLKGLEKGSEAPVIFDALDEEEFAGTVAEIVPVSAEGVHTVPVRVDIRNPMENGRPTIASGLFARVWLPVGPEHEALLVPKAALVRQQGQDLVYAVSDVPPPEMAAKMAEMADKMAKMPKPPAPAEPVGPPPPPVKYAKAVPVRIVQGYGLLMEVESEALKPGTPLITRGTYLMVPGMPVQAYPKEGETEPGGSEKDAEVPGEVE